MNNNSFYGGRDGRPMVIAKNYRTVEEMLKDFSGLESINPAEPANGNVPGKTDSGVNFGDYVIIETENRNNPENGRIFRRGFNFNNKTDKVARWHLNDATNIYEKKMYPCYGAEYISQIVGPSGNAPHLHMVSTFKDVEDVYGGDPTKVPGYDVKTGTGKASTEKELQNLIAGKEYLFNEDGSPKLDEENNQEFEFHDDIE